MEGSYETKVEYFRRKIGFGKIGTVKLYRDRFDVVSNKGEILSTVLLKDITSAAYVSGGLIRFKVGEEFHGLQFYRRPYRYFGLIGLMLSGSGKKAKALVEKMQDLGVKFDKKLI